MKNGDQIVRDTRALVDKESKEYRNASASQKLKMNDAARRQAIINYMKGTFPTAYRPPSSVGPSKSNRKPITSYD